jgi:hypothetical protein
MTKQKRMTAAEKRELEEKQVNISGQGEDPAVRAMLSDEFVMASDSDAFDVALALQQIMRGQDSILERVNANDARVAKELAFLRKQMVGYDKKSAEYEADRQKFLKEVDDLAEKVRATGIEKDKLQATGGKMFEEALEKARNERAASLVNFDLELKTMPTEQVVSPGKLEIVSVGGAPTSRLFPEVIRIKHRQWVLPPGKVVEVPKVVAEVLRQRRATEEEQEERKAILSSRPEDVVLAKKWAEIDRKYGTKAHDALPVSGSI